MLSRRINISSLRSCFKIIGSQKISADNVTVAANGYIDRIIALAENLQAELIGNAVIHVDFNRNILDFVFDYGSVFQRYNDPKNKRNNNRKYYKKFCV